MTAEVLAFPWIDGGIIVILCCSLHDDQQFTTASPNVTPLNMRMPRKFHVNFT
jgi:hypothetical protein